MDFNFWKEHVEVFTETTTFEKLEGGFSNQDKYLARNTDGTWVIQLCGIERAEVVKDQVRTIQRVAETSAKTSKIVEHGVLKNLGMVYIVYPYIVGEDGRKIIHTLSEKDQRKLGEEAGSQLALMHEVSAPPTTESWYKRAMEKHERYLRAYKKGSIKIEHDEEIMQFIERKRHLLKGRPNTFQHDDFHLGNIITRNGKYVCAIDFDNADWGDPYHDFVKVAIFQREESVPFSTGQINGYFQGEVPEEFWGLYAVYAAMVLFSSVVWCQRHDPNGLEEMVDRLYVIMDDHDGFSRMKPRWYE
ncbi:aminoglycoside phosphotransferase family protein [Halobacillus litoralis]|uniref:aminoglycoside phosphotransferase family protein n=1 Tax=Halobacillus litoralis TaxID=45668 RepID=UPI001CD1E8F7|nr:aminoglycoside phosphotransferase family protein [Halobacillus litoralis]MCA0969199.1 aminoglycoside phosphotransferase family protein [Halobacillus litoralis]